MIAYVVTDDNISVNVDGESFCVSRTAPQAPALLKALAKPAVSAQELREAMEVKRVIEAYTLGAITIRDGQAWYGSEMLAPTITKRLLDCMRTGVPTGALQNFVANLYSNPSRRAVQELYAFLEYCHLPITPAGTFLAYKAVQSDWTDKHSGKFPNYIGNVLTMPRREVDDDPTQSCSYGFHVGTLEYVTGFACGYGKPGGDRIVIVEVNPRDVVSVPFDCGCQKVRTCKYQVLQEFKGPLPEVASAGGSDSYASLGLKTEDVDEFPPAEEDEVAVYTQDEYDEAVETAADEAREDALGEINSQLREAREEGRRAALKAIKNEIDSIGADA